MADDTFTTLSRKFKELPARLEANLRVAIRIAADEAATEAKRNHDYVDRSGDLTNSIEPEGPFGSYAGDDLHAILAAGAPHALWMEKGTKPHKIRARYRKSLRFAAPEGGFMFRREVQHPGTRPRRFLANAVKAVTPRLVNELVPQAVELSFVQVGFKSGT